MNSRMNMSYRMRIGVFLIRSLALRVHQEAQSSVQRHPAHVVDPAQLVTLSDQSRHIAVNGKRNVVLVF